MTKITPKTQPTDKNVYEFLNGVENQQRRNDSLELVYIIKEVVGKEPVMWGESIVGFGSYHYASKSCEGDWMAVGFSPRKASLVIYIMPGFKRYQDLLDKLGKHKHTKSCLHLKKLSDVNLDILKKLIKQSFIDITKSHLK